jgi:signal transduction histidine kinase
VLNSLTGRFLLLTIIFVMLAEVLIFVPSVARFRVDYLQERLERSQIASLALLATPNDMVSPELEAELLDNAGVLNIVLRRDEMRELILSQPMPAMVDRNYDLRMAGPVQLIKDAFATMMGHGNRVIRVIGAPVKGAGLLIEIALYEKPLREAIINYGLRILSLSAVISVLTATLLFFAVRQFVVCPIERLVHDIKAYEAAPEDGRLIVKPKAGVTELYEAETALQSMQTQLTQSLRQKERLAALGSAVSKISHDLRNILTTAQLLADRMEASDDPRVKKTAPKLVNSISRAVNLRESTLGYGKVGETVPMITRFSMKHLLNDIVESELLAVGDAPVSITSQVEGDVMMEADKEQIYRVVSNIVRNARQVLEARPEGGQIFLTGRKEPAGWEIIVRDNGPGLPKRARDNLFEAFKGSVRKGGAGLGLAIAAELVRGHGGKLDVLETGDQGTAFRVWLPRQN